jgi:hypothetical protein
MVFPLLPDLTRFLSFAVCCCALSSSGLAAGAVAVADEPDGPGWSVGYSVRETPSVAKAQALEACRNRTIESKFDPDLCKIVSEFENRCTAASINPEGPGEGWSVADSRDAARKEAQEKCVASAGGDETKCNTSYVDCDFVGDKEGKDKGGKRPGGRPRANTPR